MHGLGSRISGFSVLGVEFRLEDLGASFVGSLTCLLTGWVCYVLLQALCYFACIVFGCAGGVTKHVLLNCCQRSGKHFRDALRGIVLESGWY